MLARRYREPFNVVIPGRALLGAGPESMLTMVVMDSGLDVTVAPERRSKS